MTIWIHYICWNLLIGKKKIWSDRVSYYTNTWGSYRVERNRHDDIAPWSRWQASYCFDEYYDEDSLEFSSLEEAKEWCWDNWVKRITHI